MALLAGLLGELRKTPPTAPAAGPAARPRRLAAPTPGGEAKRERDHRLPDRDRRPARLERRSRPQHLRRGDDRRLPGRLPAARRPGAGDLLPPLRAPAPLRPLAQPTQRTPDPFLELEAPPKPQQEADWLTEQEFARLLAAAEHRRGGATGLAERDRLVLLTLVQTGLRRAELIALDWADLDLDGPRPSLLVRRGKGGKPRRQPLAPPLAASLRASARERDAAADAPVFCGLEGKRLQPTILAGIIRRAAERAAIEKRVTAHTLRHTAATWLRQQTGDARLVAAYLGHADLSTVSRYAHVADDELHDAAAALAARAAMPTAA